MIRSLFTRSLLSLAMLLAAFGGGEAKPGKPAASEGGSLDATYTIAIGGLAVGRFHLAAAVERSRYSMVVRGGTSGVSAFVTDGTGLLKSSGSISGARVLPDDYYLDTTENGRRSSIVLMRMNAGSIQSVMALPPLLKKDDRVPVLPQHKLNIVDPLSAMIAPLYKGNMAQACNRTIPVFDGWQRFDVRLFYKSTAQVHGENGSYSGPVVVCGARYVPIAGHRPSREAVQFMANNKDLEVWLAPVEELGLMLPFRLQIGTEVGELTIHASRFVGMPSAQHAAADARPVRIDR